MSLVYDGIGLHRSGFVTLFYPPIIQDTYLAIYPEERIVRGIES